MMWSLLARLLFIVVLALVPALALQLWSEFAVRDARDQTMRLEAARLVGLVDAQQSAIVEGARQVLTVISHAPALRDTAQGSCQRLLSSVLASLPRYLAAALVGMDGHRKCAASAFDPAENLSNRSWFRLARQTGAFAVGEYAVGLMSKQPSLQMALPVRDDAGEMVGILVLSLSLDWLALQLDALTLPPGAASVVADRNGIVLARWPDNARFTGSSILPEIRFALAEPKPGTLPAMKGLDGQFRQAAFVPPAFGSKGLFVGVAVDKEPSPAPFGSADQSGLSLIVLGLLMALAITAAAGWRVIRRPFNQMLQAAESWRRGDLAARIGFARDSTEFSRLGAAFDDMAATLADREQTLRATLAGLETRVREEVAARQAVQVQAAHAERMAALGQLAGGIAHDLNNVLQMIRSGAALILRNRADAEHVHRLARLVTEAVDRGAAVTRRLLAFARRDVLHAEAVDPQALLQGIEEILSHTLGAGIAVQVRAEPGLPRLLADKGQLETVLVNLATNARDAMQGRGTLRFTASLDAAPRGSANAGPYVRLSVSDTGCGMTPDVLARATEPFFTTKPAGGGTGLGLPMARGFAEQSGGGMEIDSEVGRGTNVSLWLPVAGSAPPTQSDAPPRSDAPDDKIAETSRGAHRLLLVDDDRALRETLADQLQVAGNLVLQAASGDEALALMEHHPDIELIIADLSMPGMDGLTLLREAQQRSPDLPAILLTGFATHDTDFAMRAALPGRCAMMRKPADIRWLADRVAVMLQHRVPEPDRH